MPWYLQQINEGSGPLVPNEYVARMVSAQMPAWSSPKGRRSQLAAGWKGTARYQKHDRPRGDQTLWLQPTICAQ